MNIVVISDKNNEARRQNATQEFKKHNVEFRFFDAVMAIECLKKNWILKL